MALMLYALIYPRGVSTVSMGESGADKICRFAPSGSSVQEFGGLCIPQRYSVRRLRPLRPVRTLRKLRSIPTQVGESALASVAVGHSGNIGDGSTDSFCAAGRDGVGTVGDQLGSVRIALYKCPQHAYHAVGLGRGRWTKLDHLVVEGPKLSQGRSQFLFHPYVAAAADGTAQSLDE